MDRKYKISKTMDKNIDSIVKNYLAYIKKEGYQVEQAYLFGSYANGNAHEYSDIDVALIFNFIKDEYEMQLELMLLGEKCDLRIEPHPIAMSDFNKIHPLDRK